MLALEKLNKMRSSPPPTNLQARKALEWLDEITTSTHGYEAGKVGLQGPDDQYETWKEVERYLLPDTPLSSGDLDGVADDTRGRLNLKDGGRRGATALRDASASPTESLSPESSPEGSQATLAAQHGNGYSRNPANLSSNPVGATAGIPSSVRPLLNFVVWRTLHEDPTIAGSGKYVLLTNDRTTQKQAQKFGVRAKLLSQVATIMAKATPAIIANGNTTVEDRPIEPREAPDEEPEDEIVFNPAQRPGSSRGTAGNTGAPNVSANAKALDPDHFGRSPGARPIPSPKPLDVQPHRQAQHTSPKTTPRGQHSQQSPRIPYSPLARGQGGASPIFRGGRGRGGSMRGSPQMNARGGFQVNGHTLSQQQYAKPIDPDSYARPSSMRGRGNAMRRLWNPNT